MIRPVKSSLGFPRPVRVLYTFSVILVFLVLMAVLWFVCNEIFTAFQSICVSVATDMGVGGGTYTLVDTFFTNLFAYFLIIALIGLSYWVYFYSQRKGERFY